MSEMNSAVVLKLTDDLTAPARKAAAAARQLVADLKALSKVKVASTGLLRQIDDIAKSVRAAKTSIGGLRSELARPFSAKVEKSTLGFERIRREAREATASVRNLRREMATPAPSMSGRGGAKAHGSRRAFPDELGGRRALAAAGGVVAGHAAAHAPAP